MTIVVATTDAGLESVRARVAALGAQTTEEIAPSPIRRLVLATAANEHDDESSAATLRAEGHSAVRRPDHGVRLDAWVEHTRPIVIGERLTICFAWSEHRRGSTNVIELGAGGFGSGHHPATRLVVEALMRHL